jgi:TetR/AcrR family transcriptional repressor of nem operon
MARPKEFDQEKVLRKAIHLFSQQGFAATSTDELMRVMDVGRQSMYDTFGDKRALFLTALEMYVTESVHSITVELERSGPALSAVQSGECKVWPAFRIAVAAANTFCADWVGISCLP